MIDLPDCPILHPSPEEFSNFMGYIQGMEKKFAKDFGIIKIVPPSNFKPYDEKSPFQGEEINKLSLKGPIEQNVYGKKGIYELLLIQKKTINLQDYKKKVSHFDNITRNKTPEEIEDLFWKSITFSPPLYGADIQGSLMKSNSSWCLSSLNSLLTEGLGQAIPGVNTPYLYVGSWKSMFGWHKEDLDLNAINYLHEGMPKFWYALPRGQGFKLEEFAKKQFPEGFSRCPEYLRHKTTIIAPAILKSMIPDLKIHKMIHKKGEFIVTFGGAYHAGFNYGFNVAEAVNFATPLWLSVFLEAKNCTCLKDSVKIDKIEFLNNLMRGNYKTLPEIQGFSNAIMKKKENKEIIRHKKIKKQKKRKILKKKTIN